MRCEKKSVASFNIWKRKGQQALHNDKMSHCMVCVLSFQQSELHHGVDEVHDVLTQCSRCKGCYLHLFGKVDTPQVHLPIAVPGPTLWNSAHICTGLAPMPGSYF